MILPRYILIVMFCFLFCGVLVMLLIIVGRLVGKVAVQDLEKLSTYECGFEPMGPSRVSFSLRFFLIAILFLILDLEVVLIFPFILRLSGSYDWFFNVRIILFLLVLSVGLAHEWNEGSLDWKE